MSLLDKCQAAGGKVKYGSDYAARRAIHGIENNNADGVEPLHAYRCPYDPAHWHVGHTVKARGAPKPRTRRKAASRRAKTDRRGPGRADRGVDRPEFTRAEWDAATMTLWHRSLGRCECGCGRPIAENAERHHRQRRAVGGDRLSNLVLLLPACHTRVHREPEWARTLGLIIAANTVPTPDPTAVPLTVEGRRWLLRDDGTRTPQP